MWGKAGEGHRVEVGFWGYKAESGGEQFVSR